MGERAAGTPSPLRVKSQYVILDAQFVLHDYRQSPLVREGPHSFNQRPSYDPFGVFGAIDAVCRCLAERTLAVVSEGWCAW